jgi:type IV pilus assembly protein PilX
MKMQGQLKQKQRGAVLIVALLLLLVTTFIGFSAMETSNLEAKMATAREIKEQTFQTAENVIEQAIDNIPLIASAYATFLQSSTNWPTSSYSFTHDSNLSGDIEVQFISTTPTKGYSIRKGAAGIATYYYQLVGTGQRANSNITSTHTQGIYVEGPSLN